MFRVSSILAAFAAHVPGLIQQIGAAVTGATRNGGGLRLDRGAFGGAEDISIDRVVMEQSAGALQAVPLAAGWSGLGIWRAMHARTPRDMAGLALVGSAIRDEVVEVKRPGLGFGLGIAGIATVVTREGVTLVDIDKSARVREVIAALKTKERRQVTPLSTLTAPPSGTQAHANGTLFVSEAA
jgi:hypothetical protein